MFNFKIAATAAGVLLAMGALPANAAGFSITLNYLNTFTATQTNIIDAAANYWETAIIDYKPGVILSGITLNVQSVVNDGVNGGLAAAGPTATALRAGTIYATEGTLLFDTDDVGPLESKGKLIDVAVHEMAHALGFGTLWELNGLYDPSTGVVNSSTSGEYTGAAALAAYQSEYAPTATFVPVEKNGGSGTADAHWDETWAGGRPALMTGFLSLSASSPLTYISQTTIAAFDDLGYQVALTAAMETADIPIAAVPVPPAALLLFASIGAFGAFRRRA